MDEVVYCAKTGRPIDGNNQIAFPRQDVKPIPDPSSLTEAMTISTRLPIGMAVDQVVDDAAREELNELRKKFPEIYDPI